MSLLETIARLSGTEIIPDEYRLTALGDRCVYAEGVTCVKSFTRTEIILGVRKACLKIQGDGLEIARFCGGDAVIRGKVRSLEKI